MSCPIDAPKNPGTWTFIFRFFPSHNKRGKRTTKNSPTKKKTARSQKNEADQTMGGSCVHLCVYVQRSKRFLTKATHYPPSPPVPPPTPAKKQGEKLFKTKRFMGSQPSRPVPSPPIHDVRSAYGCFIFLVFDVINVYWMPPVYTPREICSKAGMPPVMRLWVTRPEMPIMAARPLWSSLSWQWQPQKPNNKKANVHSKGKGKGKMSRERETHAQRSKR